MACFNRTEYGLRLLFPGTGCSETFNSEYQATVMKQDIRIADITEKMHTVVVRRIRVYDDADKRVNQSIINSIS